MLGGGLGGCLGGATKDRALVALADEGSTRA